MYGQRITLNMLADVIYYLLMYDNADTQNS